ncbi:MAG: VacJ family lipoprotein [Alphaproteobacteria bacterium]
MTISRQTILRLSLVAGLGLLLGGCATPPTDPDALAAYNEANDPIEPFNRAMFDFNLKADKYVIRPLAEGYVAVVPDRGRKSVRNVLNNLRSPVIFANDVLQLEITRAFTTLARAVFNSTIGIGGLFDVVGDNGLPFHDEDFGQTLAVWGVGEGFYMVLPIFGPSNPRDAIGMVADRYLDPIEYYFSNNDLDWASWTRTVVDGIDRRAAVLDALDEIQRTSLDFYATVRSLYRQRRIDDINNGERPKGAPGPSILSQHDSPDTAARDVETIDSVSEKPQL